MAVRFSRVRPGSAPERAKCDVPDKLLEELEGTGGRVLQSSLSQEASGSCGDDRWRASAVRPA
jgi:hypothetical protein